MESCQLHTPLLDPNLAQVPWTGLLTSTADPAPGPRTGGKGRG
jgi:hypothetical protein